jgi:hypothetical protein
MSTNILYNGSGISVNSSSVISFSSNGYVGIGVTSPAYNLDIFGGLTANSDLSMNGNCSINGSGWYMSDSNYIRPINDKTMYSNTIQTSNLFNQGVNVLRGNSFGSINSGQVLVINSYLAWDNNSIGTSWFGSDITLKENFQPINIRACDLFEKIDYFSYNFKDSPTERINIGFSAQQLQTLDPQLVLTLANNKLNINTNTLSTYISKAIQELIKEDKELQHEIDSLTLLIQSVPI